MFQKPNKGQDKNIRNGQDPDSEIRDEQEAEDSLGSIGNEAASMMSEFSNIPSNEANNRGMQNNREMFLDDNKINENELEDLIKPVLENKNKIAEAGGNEGNGEIADLDQLFNADSGVGNDLEEDMIVEIDKSERRKKKSSQKKKKSKKSSAGKAAAPIKEDPDLTEADESMEPAAGWDFAAQKLPARKKQGFFSKLASWAAYYSGKTIGKAGGIIATIGKALWGLVRPGPGTLRGIINGWRSSSRFRNRGDRELIPGWDGAKFENEDVPEDEVSLDFRRVPELWAWPTAAKAVEGDEEKRNAKPLKPVISVYVSQVSDKYTATNSIETGHSSVGVEFSRYSALTGRWQRYNVRFGYYMSGGIPLTSKMAVTTYNNATLPGQIANDKGKRYDISRSWTIQPKQVGEVLRAAESYGDRGGYNAYTRNCTTFAKEMIVDVAKIKSAAGVFAKDEVYYQNKIDAKMFGAGAAAPLIKADIENSFEKIGQRDDLSYHNFGNKMLSREDYERYKKSLKLWTWRGTEAETPTAVAENLKRSEGGEAGTIGKYRPVVLNGVGNSNAPISIVSQQLIPLFTDLKATLTQITPQDKLTEAGMTDELRELMSELDGPKLFMKLFQLLPFQDDTLMRQRAKQSDLMAARTLMSDTVKKLNILLFKYYRNDKRVQEKVLNIINILNHGMNAVDEAYVRTGESDQTSRDSDLKDLYKDFGTKEYAFSYNGETMSLTASKYESLLQIYKTPQKALEQYARFEALKNKRRTEELSPEEKKEYEKFLRINLLATDFERSHRYMLGREKYSQQDVDYVFALEKKERQGGVESDMFEQDWNDPTMAKMKNPNASASAIYQMQIMKGVFGGMRDRFDKTFEGDYDVRTMLTWLAADAVDSIRNHPKEMAAIIRGMKHAEDDPDQAKLQAGFSSLLTRWLFQLFHDDRDTKQYRSMVKSLTSRNGDVMKEASKIITNVMQEKQKAESA